jgi:hypothetical protein
VGPVGPKLPVTVGRYPKDLDNYNNERLERNSDSGAYHNRLGNGPIDDIYDYNKQPRRKQLPILPDRPHPYSDQDEYAARGNRGRLGSAARTGDYYPEAAGVVDRQPGASQGLGPAPSSAQYSASYSQQNGCSIAPNAGISY